MERNIYKIGKELFITSDEEIKEGEEIKGKWLFDKDTNEVFKCLNIIAASNPDRHLFKIILTTDQDLIKDNVQKIDNEFLQWFIKNPSCEEVAVETVFGKKWKDYEYYREWHKNKVPDWAWDYKIIIPKEETLRKQFPANVEGSMEFNEMCKEEPKQDLEKEMFELEEQLDIPSHLRWYNSKPKQETLEEAAEKYDKITRMMNMGKVIELL